MHCDLKPGNVLLSFDKQKFKLADFGCGCAMNRVTQKVRRTGVDLGAKLYKTPERLVNATSANLLQMLSSIDDDDDRNADIAGLHDRNNEIMCTDVIETNSNGVHHA